MTMQSWDQASLYQLWDETGGVACRELETGSSKREEAEKEVDRLVRERVNAMDSEDREAFLHGLIFETLGSNFDAIPLDHPGIREIFVSELRRQLVDTNSIPIWLFAGMMLASSEQVGKILVQSSDEQFEQLNSLEFYRGLHEVFPDSQHFARAYRKKILQHPDARLRKETLKNNYEIASLAGQLYPPKSRLSKQYRKRAAKEARAYFTALGEMEQRDLVERIIEAKLETDESLITAPDQRPLSLTHELFIGSSIQILKEKCVSKRSGLWIERYINFIEAGAPFREVFDSLPECAKQMVYETPFRCPVFFGCGESPCALDPTSPRGRFRSLQQHLGEVLSIHRVENWPHLTPQEFIGGRADLERDLGDMHGHLAQAETEASQLPSILVPTLKMERARNWLNYWEKYLRVGSEQPIGDWISDKCGVEPHVFDWHRMVGLPLGDFK